MAGNTERDVDDAEVPGAAVREGEDVAEPEDQRADPQEPEAEPTDPQEPEVVAHAELPPRPWCIGFI